MPNNSSSDTCSEVYSRHCEYYMHNSAVLKEKAQLRWERFKAKQDLFTNMQKQEFKTRRQKSAAIYREKKREELMKKQRMHRSSQAKKDQQVRDPALGDQDFKVPYR
ncbi:hypothetical protein BDN70DRAFT_901994, partial [Pholiota conissans]